MVSHQQFRRTQTEMNKELELLHNATIALGSDVTSEAVFRNDTELGSWNDKPRGIGTVEYVTTQPTKDKCMSKQNSNLTAESAEEAFIDVGKYRLIQRDSTTVYIEIIGDGEGGEFKIADLEEFIDDFYKENF